MSDYSLSDALRGVESALRVVSGKQHDLQNKLEGLAAKIDAADKRMEGVPRDLEALTGSFREFATETIRLHALAEAKETAADLDARLGREFAGHGRTRRDLAQFLAGGQPPGLDAVDANAAAPRYWLAALLASLASWKADRREPAERTLRDAVLLADEKTSLFLSLFCRRVGRTRATARWLDRYFGLQDPAELDGQAVRLFDAFAGEFAGDGEFAACSGRFRTWVEELSADPAAGAAIRETWSAYLAGRAAAIADDEFPLLAKCAPAWPAMRDALAWSRGHAALGEHFAAIAAAPGDGNEAVNRTGAMLEALASSPDPEEFLLQRELRRRRLVVEENGVVAAAEARMRREYPDAAPSRDFGQHLHGLVAEPGVDAVAGAAKRYALHLAKPWIADAYGALAAERRKAIPGDVEIKIGDWTGKTRDGGNAYEVQSSFGRHFETKTAEAMSGVKWFDEKSLIIIVAAAFVGIIGLSTIVLPLLAVAGIAAYVNWMAKRMNAEKRKLADEFAAKRKEDDATLAGLLAETAKFRKALAVGERDYARTVEWLGGFSLAPGFPLSAAPMESPAPAFGGGVFGGITGTPSALRPEGELVPAAAPEDAPAPIVHLPSWELLPPAMAIKRKNSTAHA